MKGELVPSRVFNVLHPLLGLGDHHVAVEEGVRDALAEAFDYGRSPCDVRNEVAVHYVEVEVVCTGVEHALGLQKLWMVE